MFEFHYPSHDYRSVHFIGIGGVGMSGMAELLHAKGYLVTGSDSLNSKHTEHLQAIGIPVHIGQNASNIQNQDLFVYTDAIPETNEELVAARATGKPCVSRGVFLGALMRNYKHSIAVSGSHGKSTTTSMLTKILLSAPTDPTILLGGSLDEIEGNVRVGTDDYFLAEACEYKRNICHYYPQIAIILNIDEDHLDYYRDLDDIVDAFIDYMGNLNEDSIVILNADDAPSLRLLPHVPGKAVTFAIDNPQADYHIQNITFDPIGHPAFDLHLPDNTVEHFQLGILGRFNVIDATAAIIAAHQTGLSAEEIRVGIEGYHSLHRRLERIGTYREATVMTDYAHHPREIRVTLEALAEHKTGRLFCVFQPHTYARTRTLMKQFIECFDPADTVLLTKTFSVREIPDGSARSEDVVEKLVARGVDAHYAETMEDAERFLETHVRPNDLIVAMGAGSIDNLAYRLANAWPVLA
uniref:UDP-N-acetylmuramate--L-alanine ligase n=1 Tax=Ndongobacter massiliensis TaxID=1871025 RepID=UPI0009310F51|nr:UDP-N-acetylmuramate--L-alanine ligase [Ndongobacter massiliensis]